jgi:HEAT repeat protein
LIAALTNSKSYIRQGAALALGHLRAEEGVTAVIELLLAEPTEIWKEIARALGQVGPVALHHLTLIARERGAAARVEERVAWAMAFLGARDCRREITQMSSSQSIMAPIAAKALALVEPAIRDQQALVAEVITPEITMNRTFSRQFFGALDEHGGVVEEIGQDRGSRMVVLDDRELASKN